jgi:hypothetical protein
MPSHQGYPFERTQSLDTSIARSPETPDSEDIEVGDIPYLRSDLSTSATPIRFKPMIAVPDARRAHTLEWAASSEDEDGSRPGIALRPSSYRQGRGILTHGKNAGEDACQSTAGSKEAGTQRIQHEFVSCNDSAVSSGGSERARSIWDAEIIPPREKHVLATKSHGRGRAVKQEGLSMSRKSNAPSSSSS